MNRTNIDYLTHTWNPIAMRCTPVSAGCANCWHLAMAKRLANNPSIYRDSQKAYAGGSPYLDHIELEAPLHLKKPSRIGVQFMGDLFHESVNSEFVKEIFHVMHNSFAGDKFFVLTKRPQRMLPWFNWIGRIWSPWPIPNVWLGVSVEDQPTADERIPILLQIPAVHRWVSVEPMLGAVDLKSYFGWTGKGSGLPSPLSDTLENLKDIPGIDWVVLGGETGSHARPLHPDWVRSVRDQCQAAGVPFFFKSWGRQKCRGHLIDGQEWRQIPEEEGNDNC